MTARRFWAPGGRYFDNVAKRAISIFIYLPGNPTAKPTTDNRSTVSNEIYEQRSI
jgi:hypothetical protein